MMKNKKTLIWIGSSSLVLCIILAAILIFRRNVMQATDYVGADPSAQPPAADPATPPSGEDPEATPAPGGDGAGSSDGSVVEGMPDKPNTSPKTGHRVSIGTITSTSTHEITEVNPEGNKGLHIVEMPEGYLDWTKPANEPEVGDIVEVDILGNIYEFEVTSVRIRQNPHKITVLGALRNTTGQAIMMLLNGKMMLKIDDIIKPRVYNLYYTAEENAYIIQEINPDEGAQGDPTHPDEITIPEPTEEDPSPAPPSQNPGEPTNGTPEK